MRVVEVAPFKEAHGDCDCYLLPFWKYHSQ